MGKFVIQCPKCGRYNKASTSFFADDYVECSCGNLINVKRDRMASIVCHNCGNTVVYDQAKRDSAVCPICHEKLVTIDDMKSMTEISCPSCSCKISVSKNANVYKCPLCDEKIDVQKQIKIESMKQTNKISIIKYERPNDVFVWKHPIEDFICGSQLIVHESQEAIFFRDGEALDLFGSGRYTLETEKLPLINKLHNISVNGEAFHSEVYFINKTTKLAIKWGTDTKIRMLDPYSGLHLEIGACGTCNLRINDSRKFLNKVVGTMTKISQEDLISSDGISGIFKPLILNKVKTYLPKTMRDNDINVLEVDEHIEEISLEIQNKINEGLKEYGLEAPEFYILTIQTPDEDPNFRKLKEQNASRYLKVQEERILKMEANAKKERKIVEAETDAEEQLIKARAEAEAYRLKAEAEAEEMKMKGYTYNDETQRKVSLGAVNNSKSTTGEIINNTTSVMKDIVDVGLGIKLADKVINNVKDVAERTTNILDNDIWECPNCHMKNLKSNFCPNCGTKKGW